MNKHEEIVDVNGTQIYCETMGEGEPLVLIHGNALDVRMWDDQFEHFAKEFKVIRYDLRGFGKSAPPTEEIYSHSDDLMPLLKYFGFTQAHLLGLSLGGAVAIDFALTYPDAVKKIIVADSGLSGYEWKEFGKFYGEVMSNGMNSGVEAARSHWMTAELFLPALEQPHTAERLKKIGMDYSGWHWTNTENVALVDPPSIEQLDSITAPTLVTIGERDIPEFQEIADILNNGIPNVSKVVIPGVGLAC